MNCDEAKSIVLRNGVEMPIIGLGTSQSKADQLYKAVCCAIDLGYRHIDCAYIYGNEAVIGEAIRAKIEDGSVMRKDLFVCGKLWRTFNRPEHVQECFDESLRRLQLDYIDTFLLHWPEANQYEGGSRDYPEIPRDENDEGVHYVDTWKAMKPLLASGRARSIGISNFNKYQVEKLLQESDEIPSLNQIENHPYLNQDELVRFCQSKGIPVVGYCPLGSSERPGVTDAGPLVLNDPVLARLAKKHGKSPAQICLRFLLQRGIATIPKSVTPSRIGENFNVFDFALDEEDMEAIFSLERGQRLCCSLIDVDHKYYPFRANYSED